MKRQRRRFKRVILILIIFLCYNSKMGFVEAVSDNEITLSSNEIVEDNSKNEGMETSDSALLQIEVPTDISFVLDPFELGNKGQVYSPTFDIINKSQVDVEVEISSIQYTFLPDSGCSASAAPIDTKAVSTAKDIYLYLKWVDSIQDNEEQSTSAISDTSHIAEESDIVITAADAHIQSTFRLEAAQYNEQGNPLITPNNKITFCLDGSINPNPSDPWKQGDVKIELVYTCKAIEDIDKASISVSENGIADSSISENDIPSAPVSSNSIPDNSISENDIPSAPVSSNDVPDNSISENDIPSAPGLSNSFPTEDEEVNLTPNKPNSENSTESSAVKTNTDEKEEEKPKE